MSELKPCPFCGGEAKEQNIIIVGHGLCKMVFCEKCYIDFKNPTAIDHWNTRPAEDALKAENEKLKSDLEIQKNLTKQMCFENNRAYQETEKWKNLFYDLDDKQAKVSTEINDAIATPEKEGKEQ